MQLSAKALLRPFTSTASTDPVDAADSNISDPINDNVDDDLPSLKDVEDDDEDDDEGGDGSGEDGNGEDDDDDDEDPFDGLTPEECQELVDDTAAVKTTLDKVCSFITYIIHIIIADCFDLQDSQTLICYYPFHDNHSSSLA
jgi:hypothetical protein